MINFALTVSCSPPRAIFFLSAIWYFLRIHECIRSPLVSFLLWKEQHIKASKRGTSVTSGVIRKAGDEEGGDAAGAKKQKIAENGEQE